MVNRVEEKPACGNDAVASDFGLLFAQLNRPALLDTGMRKLVATINTPQYRRLHPPLQ